MLPIIGWIFFSFFVAFVFGVARTIGFWSSFLLSLILSPVIGLIITLCFETTEKKNQRDYSVSLQQQQLQATMNQNADVSELERLHRMKEAGAISEEEYQKLKAKIIG